MSWKGYYQQGGSHEKHPMDFSKFQATPQPGGKISGAGHDEVGEFRFAGQFKTNTPEVEFVKEYIGKHKIFYKGTVTLNPPVIVGKWGFNEQKPEDDFKLWYD